MVNTSRKRKNAYTNELENKVSRLEEEIEMLRKHKLDTDAGIALDAMSQNPTSSHSSCSEVQKVDQNVLGIPISENVGKTATVLGKLVRALVPISYISWDKVPGIYKDDVWNQLVKIYALEPLSKGFFLKRMAEAFRRHKKNLRANFYDTFNNDEERMKNCPPRIAQEDWDEFIKNEATPEASGKRESGKKNRSLLGYAHHAGRKSHARIEHEMIVACPSANINRRHVWEKTHTKKDGSISDATSSYFDQIAKMKEKIDEEKLTVDEDILSQVLGKDTRGRSRGVGTIIPKTNVMACAIAQKRLKHVRGDNEELKVRVESLEGKVEILSGQIKLLINIVRNIKQGIRASFNSSNGGRGTQLNASEFVASDQFLDMTNVVDNQKCEIFNSDLDIIAIGTVCRNSTSSKIHGKTVPSTHEKLNLDNILLPDERTSKINHQFAETFVDVGVGGYVCHPKIMIRYL